MLKQRLDFLKLARVEMEGDGNRQLRAFSTELFGTQEFHLFARSVAVEWLDQHTAEFSFFVGEQILETKILIPSGESKVSTYEHLHIYMYLLTSTYTYHN